MKRRRRARGWGGVARGRGGADLVIVDQVVELRREHRLHVVHPVGDDEAVPLSATGALRNLFLVDDLNGGLLRVVLGVHDLLDRALREELHAGHPASGCERLRAVEKRKRRSEQGATESGLNAAHGRLTDDHTHVTWPWLAG